MIFLGGGEFWDFLETLLHEQIMQDLGAQKSKKWVKYRTEKSRESTPQDKYNVENMESSY